MLVVEGLTCRFGTKAAVDNASFSIAPGGFVGVIGRSGAGKSTLLRMINRLAEPSEGRILFDGIDVTALRGKELRQWRARSAMIFQQFNLVGRLDVLTNVLMGRLAEIPAWRSLTQLWPEQDKALAMSALEQFDMALARRAARRPAFRRPAAARRDCARAGAGARHHPRRRADRLARSAQHQDRDGCAAAHQQAFRHHRDLQPAFARSGAQLLRPPDRHVGRPRGVRRRAGRADRPHRARTLRSRGRRGHGRRACAGARGACRHSARRPPPESASVEASFKACNASTNT